MGEAVSVNTGGRDITARIVGEAVSVNTGGRDIAARIVGEAVSVNTGGRDMHRCKDCGGSSICEHGRVEISPQGLWGKQYL